jgi:hypothetical protein
MLQTYCENISDIHEIKTLDDQAWGGEEAENWRLKKIPTILQFSNEPMLNLEFFNPFIRKLKNDETIFHY